MLSLGNLDFTFQLQKYVVPPPARALNTEGRGLNCHSRFAGLLVIGSGAV